MSDKAKEAKRYFDKSCGRWRRYWREPGSNKTHSQFESRWLWEREHGLIPDGYEIHHRDHDPANNALDNLELVTTEWHRAYHALLRQNHKIIEGVEHKWCPDCEGYKPLDCFYTRSKGGFRAYCKNHVRERLNVYRRERYAKNRDYREREKARMKTYYADNNDRINARDRAYHAKHRDRINARKRTRRAEKRAIREGSK